MNNKLNWFSVAFMYVGAIIGAGFASGREIWQFFGVFREKAIWGIGLAAVLLVLLGMMISYIAGSLNTCDMGKIVVPFGNKKAGDVMGYFMAFIIYTVIITMSSAGGAFAYEQFGISKAIGGLVIVLMVIFTVLGNFDRVSKVFRIVMPVLFIVIIAASILVIVNPIEQTAAVEPIKPSPMAPNFIFAALVYIAYNSIGTIPIIAETALKANSKKTAILGSGLGGLLLAAMAMLLMFALAKDPAFSNSLSLPMLGFSMRLGKTFNLIYAVVLFFSIYSAATSTFYGYSTKLKPGKHKPHIIVITALLGFVCGLLGFKRIVSYIFPIEGYIGFVILIMMIINFIYIFGKEKKIFNGR